MPPFAMQLPLCKIVGALGGRILNVRASCGIFEHPNEHVHAASSQAKCWYLCCDEIPQNASDAGLAEVTHRAQKFQEAR